MKGLYNIQGPIYKTDDWVYWYFDDNKQYHEELFHEIDGGYFPKKYDDVVRKEDYMTTEAISKDYDVMIKHYRPYKQLFL